MPKGKLLVTLFVPILILKNKSIGNCGWAETRKRIDRQKIYNLMVVKSRVDFSDLDRPVLHTSGPPKFDV